MVSDLISRKALLKEIDERVAHYERHLWIKDTDGSVTKLAMEVIESQPTVDAVEVVHGYWIPYEHKSGIPVEYDENGNLVVHTYILNQCSICGRVEKYKEQYCHCGSKMDGGKLNEM